MRLAEVIRVKLSTDPNWFGSDIDDDDVNKEPVVMLPVHKLTTFEGDAKAKKGVADAEQRKAVEGIKSALRQGKKMPPITVRMANGRYQVLDGHHRLEAYRELNRAKIPAQVVKRFNVKS